jgi:hypothetical protein
MDTPKEETIIVMVSSLRSPPARSRSTLGPKPRVFSHELGPKFLGGERRSLSSSQIIALYNHTYHNM